MLRLLPLFRQYLTCSLLFDCFDIISKLTLFRNFWSFSSSGRLLPLLRIFNLFKNLGVWILSTFSVSVELFELVDVFNLFHLFRLSSTFWTFSTYMHLLQISLEMVDMFIFSHINWLTRPQNLLAMCLLGKALDWQSVFLEKVHHPSAKAKLLYIIFALYPNENSWVHQVLCAYGYADTSSSIVVTLNLRVLAISADHPLLLFYKQCGRLRALMCFVNIHIPRKHCVNILRSYNIYQAEHLATRVTNSTESNQKLLRRFTANWIAPNTDIHTQWTQPSWISIVKRAMQLARTVPDSRESYQKLFWGFNVNWILPKKDLHIRRNPRSWSRFWHTTYQTGHSPIARTNRLLSWSSVQFGMWVK